MRQRLSLAAEPTQQRILVLTMEINPFEEMLTISGAAWLIDGQIREEPPAQPVACNSTLAIFT
jgi:hypothetical protein